MINYYIVKKQPDKSFLYLSNILHNWTIEYVEIITQALKFTDKEKIKHFLNSIETTEKKELYQILKVTTTEEFLTEDEEK